MDYKDKIGIIADRIIVDCKSYDVDLKLVIDEIERISNREEDIMERLKDNDDDEFGIQKFIDMMPERTLEEEMEEGLERILYVNNIIEKGIACGEYICYQEKCPNRIKDKPRVEGYGDLTDDLYDELEIQGEDFTLKEDVGEWIEEDSFNIEELSGKAFADVFSRHILGKQKLDSYEDESKLIDIFQTIESCNIRLDKLINAHYNDMNDILRDIKYKLEDKVNFEEIENIRSAYDDILIKSLCEDITNRAIGLSNKFNKILDAVDILDELDLESE